MAGVTGQFGRTALTRSLRSGPLSASPKRRSTLWVSPNPLRGSWHSPCLSKKAPPKGWSRF